MYLFSEMMARTTAVIPFVIGTDSNELISHKVNNASNVDHDMSHKAVTFRELCEASCHLSSEINVAYISEAYQDDHHLFLQSHAVLHRGIWL